MARQRRDAGVGGVDLRIERGEFRRRHGRQRIRQSTCMNILGCLDTPTGGEYRFQGIEVGTLTRNQRALLRRHYLGFVFQSFNLLKRTSAIENVELLADLSPHRRGAACSGKTGIPTSRPDRLGTSHAWRTLRRTTTARRHRPRHRHPAHRLARDEPTGNLDSARSVEIMELLTS